MRWMILLLGLFCVAVNGFKLQIEEEGDCRTLQAEKSTMLQVGEAVKLRCPLDFSTSCIISSITWLRAHDKDGERSVAISDSTFDPLVFYIQSGMKEESGWYFCLVNAGSQTIESAFRVDIQSNLPSTQSHLPASPQSHLSAPPHSHLPPSPRSHLPPSPQSNFPPSSQSNLPPSPRSEVTDSRGNMEAVEDVDERNSDSDDSILLMHRQKFRHYKTFGETESGSVGQQRRDSNKETTDLIHKAIGPILQQLGDLYSRVNALEKKTRDL